MSQRALCNGEPRNPRCTRTSRGTLAHHVVGARSENHRKINELNFASRLLRPTSNVFGGETDADDGQQSVREYPEVHRQLEVVRLLEVSDVTSCGCGRRCRLSSVGGVLPALKPHPNICNHFALSTSLRRCSAARPPRKLSFGL